MAQKNNSIDFFVQNQNTVHHDVIIYPNPVEGNIVNIKSPTLIKKIEISNLIGKNIKTETNLDDIFDDISISLNNLESGIYLAKITFEDDKIVIKKLIIK